MRRIDTIIRNAHVQPTLFFLALVMIHNAAILLFFGTIPPLPFPKFFGHALGIVGTIGLIGVIFRVPLLCLAFAFFGLMLRVCMTLFYIMRDWHDPAWGSYLIASAAFFWCFVRVLCEMARRRRARRLGVMGAQRGRNA